MENKSYVLSNIQDMHFEVCNVCNLSCMYCSAYHSTSDKKPFMPLKVAYKFIDLVLSKTCAETVDLMFYGGEALLQNVNWFYNVKIL